MRLTQERLKGLLDYNPETGVFTNKKTRNSKSLIGSVAGSKRRDGYWSTVIAGKRYLCHRLAWLYVYGYFPEHGVDHVDRNPSNNNISNLREVSQQCNMRNKGNANNNTSGVKGVMLNKITKKWYVQIKINKKVKNLGTYTDFQEAVCARLAGEQCVNWSGCDSNSPAFQYVQKMLGET